MNEEKKNQAYVLLVENNEMASDSLARWIKHSGFAILGPCTFKKESIKIIDENKNNIAVGIIDLKLPVPDNPGLKNDPNQGLDIARHLFMNNIPVIIVSDETFPEILRDCIKNRFSYLYKEDLRQSVVIEAIEAAIAKSVVYTETVCAELSRLLDNSKLIDPLEEIQWKILCLRRNGLTNNDIALKTNFAESTVRQKSSEIFKIIGVSNILEAARWFDINASKYGHSDLLNSKDCGFSED